MARLMHHLQQPAPAARMFAEAHIAGGSTVPCAHEFCQLPLHSLCIAPSSTALNKRARWCVLPIVMAIAIGMCLVRTVALALRGAVLGHCAAGGPGQVMGSRAGVQVTCDVAWVRDM